MQQLRESQLLSESPTPFPLVLILWDARESHSNALSMIGVERMLRLGLPCKAFLSPCPLLNAGLLCVIVRAQVVSQRFPQNSIGAVGSAMFLRFINPAIVSPYEAGILDKKPPPRIERGLKLMSKVNPERFLPAHILCSTCFSTAL